MFTPNPVHLRRSLHPVDFLSKYYFNLMGRKTSSTILVSGVAVYETKGVSSQSDGSLAMAFDEYISMHQKCLSICGYTFLGFD